MSKEEEFLLQINEKIEKFDKDSTAHKNLYRRFRYYLFAFAAITTISSGLALTYTSFQTEFNIVILIIGAFTGIVTSIEGLRRPLDLWIMERNAYYSLLDLKGSYHYQTADGSQVEIDEYHKDMQNILSASKEKWSKKLKKESQPANRSSNLTGEKDTPSS